VFDHDIIVARPGLAELQMYDQAGLQAGGTVAGGEDEGIFVRDGLGVE
jgi:hypothetical protein